MGGPNLEIFKFGMYIMFPIGWMYYFGTNLDDKFSVEDFWPTKEQLNKVPTEREDILEELERMKRRRLRRRELRLKEEAMNDRNAGVRIPAGHTLNMGRPLEQIGENATKALQREGRGWLDWMRWK
ncbi:uncharacterized protein PV09_09287 [Verruconis gallopava]|uniref:Mitochondrial cytochrome c oxidase assembly factor n=1 Tax=Verruconis gallopava TaxID=253628 RepID=A0A0D1ZWV7_9PEZI|nr:uncharacterized protein PV09_09287 [Verruconis gallopava]KIV98952.1 hypothetical protein PV09_09287 [Verruconis gallopava]